MSINRDVGLIEKYRECLEVGSMKVTILHDQITEIVVADLIVKYKACKNRNDEYFEAFAKVLRFYLTDEEMREIEGI